MLQFSMRSQLARIEVGKKIFCCKLSRERSTTVLYPLPTTRSLKQARVMLELLPADEKHWFCGGTNSSAVAIHHLKNRKIIAVPTDTIYGFAALAQSNTAIKELYALKGREKTKPLAIMLASLRDIPQWAMIDHIPPRLLRELLPGPVTVVLKRTQKLNPALNPGHDTVGIRIPCSTFLRHLCRMIGQPIALTSANLSNEPSSLCPKEFSSLWPKLAAIFYQTPRADMLQESQRVGSTVVDLTVPGEFEILRRGIRFEKDLRILNSCGRERQRVEDDSTIRRQECR